MGVFRGGTLAVGCLAGTLAWGGPGVVAWPDAAAADGRLVLVQADAAAGGNPFAGREIGTAREALDILLEEMGLGSIVAYRSISEPDPESVTLDGVVLADPDDPSLRLEIGRIVIGDLDLAGLGTVAGPSRFRVAFEAIDYAGLIDALRRFAPSPAPELEAGATLTLAFSLLPAVTSDGRMTATMLGQLDRQLALSVEMTAVPPPGAASLDPFAAAETRVDAFAFELADWGFLGAALRAQAAEAGQSFEAFIAEGKAELAAALEPMPLGSPAAAAHDALTAMLDDLDRPGVLRFSLESAEARPLQSLFEALAVAETLEADGLRFSIGYLPME